MSAETYKRHALAFIMALNAGPPPWTREQATAMAKAAANMIARTTCVIVDPEGNFWPTYLTVAVDMKRRIVEHFEPEEQE